MRNEIAFALIVVAWGGGVLLGRTLPRDPPRGIQAAARPVPAATFVPSRPESCRIERAELARTKVQLAICTAFVPHDPPDEPPAETAVETPDDIAAKRPNRMRRNAEVLNTPGELIFVRHSDGAVVFYPADQQIDDGLIIARRLPSGEIAYYDPDAGPRTDPSAFRVPPPGSPLAPPKIERGPDGLLYINGKLADPAVQKMFALPPR